ncbi:HipA family kinase [Sporomusa aerivorans]|uniref:HipA family kinase n=1 Tax=Sporomusa aerivorans TaxID=204936 RepID=UPI003529EED6
MLLAVEYLGKVGVGVTKPQFFQAQDGNVYVVKFQDSRLGSRVLVSEFFAAKIGAIMNLCFPPSEIIEINNEILENNPELIDLGIAPGRHFASLYLEQAGYVGKDRLHKAVNLAEMAGVLLFDHMFHNADRAKNQKNLLLNPQDEQYRVYAIDNSHLFRSSRWTLETLQNLCTKIKIFYFQHYRILLKDLLSSQDFMPYVNIVKTISNEKIDCIIKEIPSEWLPEECERQALADFAKMRRDMVDEIWVTLNRYIPRSRGGQRWLFAK